jgi:hypothetical protein
MGNITRIRAGRPSRNPSNAGNTMVIRLAKTWLVKEKASYGLILRPERSYSNLRVSSLR